MHGTHGIMRDAAVQLARGKDRFFRVSTCLPQLSTSGVSRRLPVA
jgi:hypothetical protein